MESTLGRNPSMSLLILAATLTYELAEPILCCCIIMDGTCMSVPLMSPNPPLSSSSLMI